MVFSLPLSRFLASFGCHLPPRQGLGGRSALLGSRLPCRQAGLCFFVCILFLCLLVACVMFVSAVSVEWPFRCVSGGLVAPSTLTLASRGLSSVRWCGRSAALVAVRQSKVRMDLRVPVFYMFALCVFGLPTFCLVPLVPSLCLPCAVPNFYF